jgi:predicted acylesterase/phospholipase RssA
MVIKNLVFSGGGPNGLSQFGAIKRLSEDTIDLNNIENIYATSIGSVLSLLLALKVDMIDIEEYLIKKSWSRSFLNNTNEIFNLDNDKGLINHNFIKDILECFYKAKDVDININFKDLYKISKKRLHFYSIKLNDYTLTEFSYKTTPYMPVMLACIASCSLPPIFGPFLYKSEYYIDGGFFNNYPINSCLESTKCKHEEIFGIRVRRKCAFKYNNIENDTFPNYLCKITGDLIGKNMTDDFQTDISNNLVINAEFETTNIELWDNFANNIEFRKNLITNGYKLADEFIEKIQQTS